MIWTKLLPYAFVLVFGVAVGSYGTMQITKAAKPEIKLACPPPIVKCPDPVNTIDFDKVKNFKGTLKIDQTYKVEINGDSLLLKKLNEEIDRKLKELRLARCK